MKAKDNEEITKQLGKAMVEIFGRDLPEKTSIYSQDK